MGSGRLPLIDPSMTAKLAHLYALNMVCLEHGMPCTAAWLNCAGYKPTCTSRAVALLSLWFAYCECPGQPGVIPGISLNQRRKA